MNLAYVAGFFDGEGCVGFARCRSTIFPRILVTNTNRDVLEELQANFGGDIKPLSLRKEAWKQGYSWRLSWSKAVDFLERIHPYLRLKSRQAETVFAWDAIRVGRGNRCAVEMAEYHNACDLLISRMRWLNQKGIIQGADPIEAEL